MTRTRYASGQVTVWLLGSRQINLILAKLACVLERFLQSQDGFLATFFYEWIIPGQQQRGPLKSASRAGLDYARPTEGIGWNGPKTQGTIYALIVVHVQDVPMRRRTAIMVRLCLR